MGRVAGLRLVFGFAAFLPLQGQAVGLRGAFLRVRATGAASTVGLVDDSSNGVAGVGTRRVGVAVADGLTEFLGYFYQGDTAARAASSLIGLNRPLQYDSTRNLYFVASTNSTVALVNVRIVDFPTDVLGDSGGVPCLFKFLSSAVHPAIANPVVA